MKFIPCLSWLFFWNQRNLYTLINAFEYDSLFCAVQMGGFILIIYIDKVIYLLFIYVVYYKNKLTPSLHGTEYGIYFEIIFAFNKNTNIILKYNQR